MYDKQHLSNISLQHLSNIWSSVYEKVKQLWGWVEKSIAYQKDACKSYTTKSFRNIFLNVPFCFTYLSLGNFLFCHGPKYFILSKNLNTTCTSRELKQMQQGIVFLVKIFISFVKLLNIILNEYSLFLSHVKLVFIGDRERPEKTILMLLSMEVINKLFRATANIQ